MHRNYFLAQDQAGNTQKVHVARHGLQNAPSSDGAEAEGVVSTSRTTYSLSAGSPVRRIDNETFLVVDTGAYVTVIRD